MRSTIIKTVIAISISVALFPQIASATTPSFSCSSNLVISLDNGYSASCDGDFSFTDGVLQNDTSISLIAGGSIVIGSNFELASPIINLNAGNIQIDGRVTQNLEINTSTLTKGNTKFDWHPRTGFMLTADIIDTPAMGHLKTQLLTHSLLQTNSGGNLSLGSIPSGAILNSTGGSIVIRPDVTGSLISNTDTITNNGGLIVSSVPEPSTYLMMILGLIPLTFTRKRKLN